MLGFTLTACPLSFKVYRSYLIHRKRKHSKERGECGIEALMEVLTACDWQHLNSIARTALTVITGGGSACSEEMRRNLRAVHVSRPEDFEYKVQGCRLITAAVMLMHMALPERGGVRANKEIDSLTFAQSY